MTTIKADFSECYTVESDPIAASVIEDNYLWWPVGVKPPHSNSQATLVGTSTDVTITKNVSISLLTFSNLDTLTLIELSFPVEKVNI